MCGGVIREKGRNRECKVKQVCIGECGCGLDCKNEQNGRKWGCFGWCGGCPNAA